MMFVASNQNVEGRLALKFMYHILINYGTHSHLSDPSKIGTHIHVSHFFATLGDKVVKGQTGHCFLFPAHFLQPGVVRLALVGLLLSLGLSLDLQRSCLRLGP